MPRTLRIKEFKPRMRQGEAMHDESCGVKSGRAVFGGVSSQAVDVVLAAAALLLVCGAFLVERRFMAGGNAVAPFALWVTVGGGVLTLVGLLQVALGESASATVGVGFALVGSGVAIPSPAKIALLDRLPPSADLVTAGLAACATLVLGWLALREVRFVRVHAPLLWRDGVARQAQQHGPPPEVLNIEAVRRLAADAEDLRDSRHERSHTSEADALLYEARWVVWGRREKGAAFLVLLGMVAAVSALNVYWLCE